MLNYSALGPRCKGSQHEARIKKALAHNENDDNSSNNMIMMMTAAV
jgi:hypothetical protein